MKFQKLKLKMSKVSKISRLGRIFSEIWGERMLDGQPVVAKYVEDKKLLTSAYSERRVAKHCRNPQYCCRKRDNFFMLFLVLSFKFR